MKQTQVFTYTQNIAGGTLGEGGGVGRMFGVWWLQNDHIVLVMSTGNSLVAKCIPNSGRQAQTNSRTQKVPAHTIEKECIHQKLASWLVST